MSTSYRQLHGPVITGTGLNVGYSVLKPTLTAGFAHGNPRVKFTKFVNSQLGGFPAIKGDSKIWGEGNIKKTAELRSCGVENLERRLRKMRLHEMVWS